MSNFTAEETIIVQLIVAGAALGGLVIGGAIATGAIGIKRFKKISHFTLTEFISVMLRR